MKFRRGWFWNYIYRFMSEKEERITRKMTNSSEVIYYNRPIIYGRYSMLKNFSHVIFMLNVLDLAKKYNFSFTVYEKNVKVVYPNCSADQSITLTSEKDFYRVCEDIIKWR